MDEKRIINAMENALVRLLHKDNVFKIDYKDRININSVFSEAYENIDFEKVKKHMTEKLEEIIAEKIVNKIVTEMGTDIKELMSKESVRDDFRFFLRKGVEKIIKKAEKTKP